MLATAEFSVTSTQWTLATRFLTVTRMVLKDISCPEGTFSWKLFSGSLIQINFAAV